MTDTFLYFANITALFALWLVGMATILLPLATH